MLRPAFTLWLPQAAYIQLLEEALHKMPRETGGVLIGYWGAVDEAVVTAVVGPGPKAVHKKRSFRPDNQYHTQAITYHYQQSGRTETYLGDWHSHPKAAAYMSKRDEQTLCILADYKQARLVKPLMMILGTEPLSLHTWMHAYDKSSFFRKSVISPGTLQLF